MTSNERRTKNGTIKRAIAVVPATLLLATALPAPAMAATQMSERSYSTDFDGLSIDTGNAPTGADWRMSGPYDAAIVDQFVLEAATPAWDGVSASDLSFMGENDRSFRPADLAPGQSVTLTTTVDRLQSDWVASGNNFSRLGLVTVGSDGKPVRVTGDPIIETQTNNGAQGNPVCVSGIYVQGEFLGPDHTCANPLDGADQTGVREGGTLRYSVTINADGTWSGSVVPLDSGGRSVGAFLGAAPDWSFSGKLSDPNAAYMPYLLVKGGTGSKTLTVSDTDLSRPVPGDAKLRISNARTTGSFGDQLFSPTLAVAATEGDTDNRFDVSFVIEPTPYQEGLVVTVSPDNGQGGRNGFLRIKHVNGGMTIEAMGSIVNDKGDSEWETVEVASGLSVTEAHTVNMQVVKWANEAKAAVVNDVFRVWIDDRDAIESTTFEAYYQATGEANYATDTLLFRMSGTAAPQLEGQGLLIDDLSMSISTEQPPAAEGEGPEGPVMPTVKPEVDDDQTEGDGVVDSEEDTDDTLAEGELADTGAGGLAIALLGSTLLAAGGATTALARRRG
jgi:hypothetical protein